MTKSVPSMASGSPNLLQPVETAPRAKDKIVADLELVSKRRNESRAKIKNDDGKMSPQAFNEVSKKIAEDSDKINNFLGELFDLMCWEEPERLKKA